jgi:hypothetical protein
MKTISAVFVVLGLLFITSSTGQADKAPQCVAPMAPPGQCTCNGAKAYTKQCSCGTTGVKKTQNCWTKYLLGTSTPCGDICESCYNVCNNNPSNGCQ